MVLTNSEVANFVAKVEHLVDLMRYRAQQFLVFVFDALTQCFGAIHRLCLYADFADGTSLTGQDRLHWRALSLYPSQPIAFGSRPQAASWLRRGFSSIRVNSEIHLCYLIRLGDGRNSPKEKVTKVLAPYESSPIPL